MSVKFTGQTSTPCNKKQATQNYGRFAPCLDVSLTENCVVLENGQRQRTRTKNKMWSSPFFCFFFCRFHCASVFAVRSSSVVRIF